MPNIFANMVISCKKLTIVLTFYDYHDILYLELKLIIPKIRREKQNAYQTTYY